MDEGRAVPMWTLTATCEHGVSYKVTPEQIARGPLPPCTCKAEVEAWRDAARPSVSGGR